MSVTVEPASFRDPSGFVFYRDGILYRQVRQSYRTHYDLLMQSGLYSDLAAAHLLIAHTEDPVESAAAEDAYRVLRPERLVLISYPYEWCFSQLQDAALLTLDVQKRALNAGMWLKDASAYNVQFSNGKPILIDTLSFERYDEGGPWAAYRQFCQHFLAPLALMSRTDVRLNTLLRTHIDGIPLDLASRLLPRTTWLQPGLLAHIHLHGAAQKRFASEQQKVPDVSARISRTAVLGLIDSLETTVRALKWNPAGTTWADYYANTNYTDAAMKAKQESVRTLLGRIAPAPASVWDLGANTGLFSRVAAAQGAQTVAWDMDPAAVEQNYLECRRNGATKVLPLLGDLTNPSPALGWALTERQSLLDRGPVSLILALALVHHLAIGNNVPLSRIAAFFADLAEWAIVEFVPKSDSQVQRLLRSREDIFDNYTQEGFEAAFQRRFNLIEVLPLPESERSLYLMQAHGR